MWCYWEIIRCDHEDGALMSRICIIQKYPEILLSLSITWKCKEKSKVSSQKVSTRAWLARTLNSDLQPLEMWEINACCVQVIHLCDTLLNQLEQVKTLLNTKLPISLLVPLCCYVKIMKKWGQSPIKTKGRQNKVTPKKLIKQEGNLKEHP